MANWYQKIIGSISGNVAEVTATNSVKVHTGDAGVAPGDVGASRVFSEVDAGTVTGAVDLIPPETDDDFKFRIAHEFIFDTETYNYAAQNTGKHSSVATTMVPAWTVSGYKTNSTGITTTTTGVTGGTYSMFPLIGGNTMYLEVEAGFDAQPVANVTIDFGLFLRAGATPFAPTDGCYFRLTSAGLQGIINNNGSETSSGIFTWTYVNSQKYQFIISISERDVTFWVDSIMMGDIATPVGAGQPFMASSLPFSFRHAIAGGAAGGSLTWILNDYTISNGGANLADNYGAFGQRVLGSYQGLSGGTMGSLMSGTVTTGSVVPPTAAVPTNTTAALGTGLGGTFYETVSLAVATDGIIDSHQVPAGTVNVPGRRLRVNGVALASFVQTVVAGGPYCARFYVAFGHTAVSLQTAEAAGTKAARRVMLPFVQIVTAAQAVSTAVAQNVYIFTFANAIYVNAGEFLQLVTTHTGTVGTSGTVAHQVTWDYAWE